MFDDPVVVVVPSDPYLSEPGLQNRRVSHQVVHEINRLIRRRFEESPFGPFDRSLRLTSDGTVVVVPTPGHVSVIAVDGDVSYFLAGDARYTQKALVERQVDGVSPSEPVALHTLQTILRYAHDRSTVYLPMHDPESTIRLAKGMTVDVDG
jgi:hypothetical protein